MKVKEVAEFLKVSTDELLKLLKNVSVGQSYTIDTEIDKNIEKKLAKCYGVPYPFKAKPKPASKAPAKPAPKAEKSNDTIYKKLSGLSVARTMRCRGGSL